MNLIWFRKDLRLADNPALYAAMLGAAKQQRPSHALFIVSPTQWQQHNMAAIQADFIEQNLHSLFAALSKLGVTCHVELVERFREIPTFLQHFCQQHKIQHIFANTEPELNEVRRDKAVLSAGLPLTLYESHCIAAPGTVFTQSGAMFRVFTPFRKKWLEQIKQTDLNPLPIPNAVGPAVAPPVVRLPGKRLSTDDFSESHASCRLWPAGEAEAHTRLRYFIEHHLAQYHEHRDRPDLAATSTLSPWLAQGVISPRQCLSAVLAAFPYAMDDHKSGAFCWINELAWREFYRHLLIAFPELSKGENFQKNANHIAWQEDETGFQAWCEGNTGYPLVDAAMKQLLQTGWMHNRLRMVVASFLTKHLLINWRKGEAFFSQHLIDGDLAANNGGWQWAASTGCDAQPYFRIFNPIRQSERFDPEGTFIRSYLPELNEIKGKDIHFPSPIERTGHYAMPVIEHQFARERALQAFAVLSAKNI